MVFLMTKENRIFIKNIYYMLSYAFKALKQSNYEEIAAEDFDYIEDLFAAILSKGIAQQLKHGLYREYMTKSDSLSVMRGKLNISGTVQHRLQRDHKLSCEFDELSENTLMNQILKTTMIYLIRQESVKTEHKQALKKLLVYFGSVELLNLSRVPWPKLQYHRNNKNYELLMNVCYFLLDGMLQTTESGNYRMQAFTDKYMSRLYEKFILEYYRVHHPYLTEVKASQITWDLEGDTPLSIMKFLPTMQSDVFLRMDDKIVIIDAKFYNKTMQQQFDKHTLHSNNLYQIYSYVKNQDKENTGNVSGILLYAKTDEALTPDCQFNMGGNMIAAQTLDLNTDFKFIAKALDEIPKTYLLVRN